MKKSNQFKKKKLNILKKQWPLIWLICAAICVGSFIAFADYTGLTSVKRVASTVAAPGELFSSNIMREAVSNHRITSSEYTITVCNYEQDNPGVYNSSDIVYTLEAELNVFYDGNYLTMSQLQDRSQEAYNSYLTKITNRTYSIKKTMEDGTPILDPQEIVLNAANGYKKEFASCRLTKDQFSTANFMVKFDAEELRNLTPEFYIHVKATPVEGPVQVLEGRLYAVENSSEATAWQGVFQEEFVSTTDYDFYNYIISGNGTGIVEITWNPSKFEINPFFFSDSAENSFETYTETEGVSYDGKVLTKDGVSKTRLVVNSSQKNRYELQLYKTEKTSSYTGNNAANNHISCTFTSNLVD